MKRLPFRQGGTLALTLAVLAAVAIALWLGVFSQKWAAGAADGGLNVSIASTPASGTTLAQGNIINYTVTVSSDAVTAAADGNITLLIVLSNATLVAGSFSSPHSIACTGAGPIDCQVPNFAAAGSKTVSFNATVGATGPVLVGAAIDPPVNGSGVGEVDEEPTPSTPTTTTATIPTLPARQWARALTGGLRRSPTTSTAPPTPSAPPT